MVSKREHPTKICPTHGTKLWYTTSREQLVCVANYDCQYTEPSDVDVQVTIPKTVARAMRRLRKRTRRMLRRRRRSDEV